METITAAEMRTLEQKAISSGRVTGLELMEHAGQGVVDAILEKWPDFANKPHRAVGLCGPGNNGGDGFVVARLLHQRGWKVDVFLYGEPKMLPPDARVNYELWARNNRVKGLGNGRSWLKSWAGIDIAVDALFGIGLQRPIEDLATVLWNLDDAAGLVSDPNAVENGQFVLPKGIVAVDFPSGIDADTGHVLQPSHGAAGAASANLTVTFHLPKPGHLNGEGPLRCGTLVVKDIGL